MEIYKDIRQFEPTKISIKKEISNYGNIKTTFKTKIRINNGSLHREGYNIVEINKKKYKVHRLVLEHFVGECPIGFECDHFDRNRSNNHIDNLRWVSRSDNQLNKGDYKHKGKKGCIKQRGDKWRFHYRINKNQKVKSFNTEIEAKIAQAFYKGVVNIIENY